MNTMKPAYKFNLQALIVIRLYGPRSMKFSESILNGLVDDGFITGKNRPYQLTKIGKATADKEIQKALFNLSKRES